MSLHRWTGHLDRLAGDQRAARELVEELDERLRANPDDEELARRTVNAVRRLEALDAEEAEVRELVRREAARR